MHDGCAAVHLQAAAVLPSSLVSTNPTLSLPFPLPLQRTLTRTQPPLHTCTVHIPLLSLLNY